MIAKVGAELDGNMTLTERAVRAQFKKAIEDNDTQAWKALAQHSEGTKGDVTSNGETINPITVYLPHNGRDNDQDVQE
jgi:hypothetical protein